MCSNAAGLGHRASSSVYFNRVLGHTGHHLGGDSWLRLDDGVHNRPLDFNALRCVANDTISGGVVLTANCSSVFCRVRLHVC